MLSHYVKLTLDKYKYDSAIVPVDISDILRCKKVGIKRNTNKYNRNREKLSKIFKISKLFGSSMLPSSRTKINRKSLSEKLKMLCFRNNLTFIDHQEITSNDI